MVHDVTVEEVGTVQITAHVAVEEVGTGEMLAGGYCATVEEVGTVLI